MRGLTAHAGAQRPTRGRGAGLLENRTQRSSNPNTHGDANCDVVECNAKSHTDSRADGNAHADGRLTFLAIGHVGPPMQSSTTTTLRV